MKKKKQKQIDREDKKQVDQMVQGDHVDKLHCLNIMKKGTINEKNHIDDNEKYNRRKSKECRIAYIDHNIEKVGENNIDHHGNRDNVMIIIIIMQESHIHDNIDEEKEDYDGNGDEKKIAICRIKKEEDLVNIVNRSKKRMTNTRTHIFALMT